MILARQPLRGLYLPPGTPRINWDHPITEGLKNVWVHDGSNVPISLVAGFALNQGTLGTSGLSKAGSGFQFNGSSQLAYGNSSSISGLNAFTLFTFITPLALSTGQRYFAHANGTAGLPSVALGSDSTTASSARIVVSDSAGNSVTARQPSGTLAVGQPIAIGGNAACNGTGTTAIYVNGARAAQGAATAAAFGTSNTTTVGGQRFNSTSGSFANAIVHLAAEWNRTLTDAEHELLGQNPTAFLLYPEDDEAALFVANTTTLSSGAAVITSVGSGTISASVGNPSNGSTPFTFQWYGSTTANFTPGVGNLLSSKTAQTVTVNSLTNGTPFYLRNIVTDHLGATATSNQISATPQAVAAGGVSFSSVTASTLTVTTPGASGGTGPYSYQFQRAPDVSGSPGTFANLGTAGSALSYNDSSLSL